jgi:hypothetical protein
MRLRGLETRADRDARYRIDEFFCFDDTWRATVSQLLGQSDVVVMDLRSFGVSNEGSKHELQLLASRGALGRTVLLVDDRTDRQLLDSILSSASESEAPTVLVVLDDRAEEATLACLTAAGMQSPVTGSPPSVA